MITPQIVNNILGITESFQMPERLLSILLSDDCYTLFDSFMKYDQDLSFDWFTDYFQEQHSNRETMMQDFTPRELTQLLPELADHEFNTCLDICSGTGGLTIGAWNKNPDAYFVCEELSERAIPLLLFNLAIRNVNGMVINKDVLSGEVKRQYKLIKSKRYSEIEVTNEAPGVDEFDLVVSNPPYSLKHQWDEAIPDVRFGQYPYPPSQFSDWAFVILGIRRLSKDGTYCGILPHGVLFRGSKEKEIRRRLIEDNRLKGVIGVPAKLFLNTDIPVCVLIASRNSSNLMIIDYSREYEEGRKQNKLRSCDLEKIVSCWHSRKNVEKYASVIPYEEVAENDFNLNIPRYVNTFEPEPLPDMVSVVKELANLDREIDRSAEKLARMMSELKADTEDDQKIINAYIRYLRKRGREHVQLELEI